MNYPPMYAVERATRMQLAKWFRFLPSPGGNYVSCPGNVFNDAMILETQIMNRICERFTELGGMTPEISKAIGLKE